MWIDQTIPNNPVDFTSVYRQSNEELLKSILDARVGPLSSSHMEEANHFIGWVYAAVHKLSLQASQSRLKLYSCDYSGTEETDEPLKQSDPIYRLLRRPNPKQTWSTFAYNIEQQKLLTGKAFIWKVPNRINTFLSQMWVLPTGLLFPAPPSMAYPNGAYYISAPLVNSVLGYTIAGTAGWLSIPSEQLEQVFWPHPLLSWDGVSPLHAASTIIDIDEETRQKALAILRNTPDPKITVDLGENATKEQADAYQMMLRQKAGPNKAGDPLVTYGGGSANVIGGVKELDFTRSMESNRNNVLGIFGTPAVALGIVDAGSYAAFYTALMAMVELTVQPSLNQTAEAIEHIFHLYRPDLRVEITAHKVNDPQMEQTKLDKAASAGVITVNEYRARLGMPPVDWGDVPVKSTAAAKEESIKSPENIVPEPTP